MVGVKVTVSVGLVTPDGSVGHGAVTAKLLVGVRVTVSVGLATSDVRSSVVMAAGLVSVKSSVAVAIPNGP